MPCYGLMSAEINNCLHGVKSSGPFVLPVIHQRAQQRCKLGLFLTPAPRVACRDVRSSLRYSHMEGLQGLEEVSPRLKAALLKLNDDDPGALRLGLEELTSLTKRSDDVSDCLDVLLSHGLLTRILNLLHPDVLHNYGAGEVGVRGLAVMPVMVSLGEAVQLAACTALGELGHFGGCSGLPACACVPATGGYVLRDGSSGA